jgi:O-antigen ligase
LIETRASVTIWIVLTVVTLAWGAAAFGSPYPWAYRPLIAACSVLGALGLWVGRRPLPWPVLIGFVSFGIAAVVQLIPLPFDQITKWSPEALSIHRQRNIQVAVGLIDRVPLSIDAGKTALGLTFLGAFLLLMAGTARILSREGARKLAEGITILGVVVAMAGIIQRATFNGKVYGFWELQQGGLPFGPFINRNHFAGWMLMVVPLTIGLFASIVGRALRGTRPRFRDQLMWFSSPEASKAILVGFAILAMVLSLFLTFSRSGIMALAFGILVATIAMARRQPTLKRRIMVSSFMVVMLLTLAAWVGLDRLAARFDASDPFVAMSGRPQIWSDTVRIARMYPLTGTGLNTFGVSTLFYQRSQPGEHLNEAHNDYLQLAAEGGFLLGLPSLFTIGAFAWLALRRLSQDEGSIWWIRMGALTGVLAIAVQSLVEFSLQMPANAALFSVLVGIALHDSRTL